jgi:hypothetical protein
MTERQVNKNIYSQNIAIVSCGTKCRGEDDMKMDLKGTVGECGWVPLA